MRARARRPASSQALASISSRTRASTRCRLSGWLPSSRATSSHWPASALEQPQLADAGLPLPAQAAVEEEGLLQPAEPLQERRLAGGLAEAAPEVEGAAPVLHLLVRLGEGLHLFFGQPGAPVALGGLADPAPLVEVVSFPRPVGRRGRGVEQVAQALRHLGLHPAAETLLAPERIRRRPPLVDGQVPPRPGGRHVAVLEEPAEARR